MSNMCRTHSQTHTLFMTWIYILLDNKLHALNSISGKVSEHTKIYRVNEKKTTNEKIIDIESKQYKALSTNIYHMRALSPQFF